jgi:integrative and conjugative element protein (TIGR02256 family)
VIVYPIGISGQKLVFTKRVVAHLEAHRQLRLWNREAGGQLFACICDGDIIVQEATGPRPTDQRSRWSYLPDRPAEQQEIDALHASGYFYVGSWHTHPQRRPTPSSVDLASLAESVRLSEHSLNGFLLAVMGQEPAPDGLYVAVGDGTGVYRLEPDCRRSSLIFGKRTA